MVITVLWAAFTSDGRGTASCVDCTMAAILCSLPAIWKHSKWRTDKKIDR